MLDIVAGYHRMQFQGKRVIQTQENGEKPHFGLDLGSLDPNLGRQIFFTNLTSPVIRYHGQLSSCTMSIKTNGPILRKVSNGRTDGQTHGRTDGQTDRQTDGQTDRQTDERDFIGCCQKLSSVQ